MALTDLPGWIDEHCGAPVVWFVKRLQANDTLATGSHQAGPYLPKDFVFAVFPEIHQPATLNPRVEFDVYTDSQGDHRRARAIWYNNRLHGGTRNETRITGFGGLRSDLLDPESTGAVAIMAFDLSGGPVTACHVWVCRDDTESDLVEGITGRVDPSKPVIWTARGTPSSDRFGVERRREREEPKTNKAGKASTQTTSGELPQAPMDKLVRQTAVRYPFESQPVDVRLLRRHEALIDEHDTAELGMHFHHLLLEEGFQANTDFIFQSGQSTPRPPDFIFPATRAGSRRGRTTYKVELFIEQVVRDRWQTLVQGQTSPLHLLTVQRGVSASQYEEMKSAGITLVVPARLHDTYPSTVRQDLKSVESFLAEVRHLGRTPADCSAAPALPLSQQR